jgi:hypothetical protein
MLLDLTGDTRKREIGSGSGYDDEVDVVDPFRVPFDQIVNRGDAEIACELVFRGNATFPYSGALDNPFIAGVH